MKRSVKKPSRFEDEPESNIEAGRYLQIRNRAKSRSEQKNSRMRSKIRPPATSSEKKDIPSAIIRGTGTTLRPNPKRKHNSDFTGEYSRPRKRQKLDDDDSDRGESDDDNPKSNDSTESKATTEDEYYMERIIAYERDIKEDSCLFQCPSCGEERPKKHFQALPFIDVNEKINPMLANARIATETTEVYGVSRAIIVEKYRKKLDIYRRNENVSEAETFAVCNYWFVPFLPVSHCLNYLHYFKSLSTDY